MIKPVNLEALTKWVGAIPEDVKRDLRSIAPMLERLGYDPTSTSPNYGAPDSTVQHNTEHIREQHEYWKLMEKQVQSLGKKQQKEQRRKKEEEEGKKYRKVDVDYNILEERVNHKTKNSITL